MHRRIPYAVANYENYEKIVRDGYHFVDKIRFIRINGLETSFNLACRDVFKVFAAENSRHANFAGVIALESAADALRHILGEVRGAGAPPVHIIVDEYDNFTNQLLVTPNESHARSTEIVLSQTCWSTSWTCAKPNRESS